MEESFGMPMLNVFNPTAIAANRVSNCAQLCNGSTQSFTQSPSRCVLTEPNELDIFDSVNVSVERYEVGSASENLEIRLQPKLNQNQSFVLCSGVRVAGNHDANLELMNKESVCVCVA
jgi:hypothetical protein